jgi:hypothetical protein
MSLPESVVVRLPRNSGSLNGEPVEYRVSPKSLATILLEFIESENPPEFIKNMDEDKIEEALQIAYEILGKNCYKQSSHQHIHDLFDKLVLKK